MTAPSPPAFDSIAALDATEERVVPWLSESELEIRARLAAIESHQLRSDRLLTEVQLEVRRASRSATQLALRIEAKVDSLVSLIRSREGNGHV